MIDTKALRNKILDLAISGKLTEQFPEDGNAEDLYAQIQEEKARLIAEGKIKKEKPMPPINEDEIPFDIPDNWKWVQWGSIVNIVSARRVHQSDWRNEGIPFYRAREIAKLADNGFIDNDLFISQDLYNEFSKSGVPKSGDLMVTAVGTLGKTYVVKDTDRFYYKDASVICLENYSGLNSEYLRYLMESNMMLDQIRSNSGGTTVDTLTMVRMIKYIVPLPPLAEQKRIVSAVEDAFAVIDRIEKAQESYYADQEVLRNKIIDAGIRGKLTEQLPEDGNAEDLYAQIQEEKARLISEGKIKKEKPLPPIADEEIPFEIPENWKWVRLGELTTILGGKRIPAGRSLTSVNTGQKYIRVSDMKNRTVQTQNLLYVPDDIIPTIARYIINKEDVYITVAGTIGKVGKIPEELDGANLTENADRIVFTSLSQDWLISCLESAIVQRQIEDLTTQVAQPKLAIQRIQGFSIPLPPLLEQERISNKIEKLLSII